ncbi:hypothetical protein HK405_004923, partial [Cladochytrium tenue]
ARTDEGSRSTVRQWSRSLSYFLSFFPFRSHSVDSLGRLADGLFTLLAEDLLI